MSSSRMRQCLKVITAFQQRDQFAIGMLIRYLHHALAHPAVTLGREIYLGQWIGCMRIETRGN